MKFSIIISSFLVILLFLINISAIKIGVSHRFNRNSYLKCTNESVCSECTKEEYYKKCDSICYCCNASSNKCISQ